MAAINTTNTKDNKGDGKMKTPKKSKTTPSKARASGGSKKKMRKLKQTPKASTPATEETTLQQPAQTVTPPTKESKENPMKAKSTSSLGSPGRKSKTVQEHILSTPLIIPGIAKPNRYTCFTPDGQYVFTLSSPGSTNLQVVSVQGGVHCGTLTMPNPVYSMCFMDYQKGNDHEDMVHVLVCTGKSLLMLWKYDIQCIMTGSKPNCSMRRLSVHGLALSHAVSSSEHSTIYAVTSYVRGKQNNCALLCITIGDNDVEGDPNGSLSYKTIMKFDEVPRSLRICNGQLMVHNDHSLNFFDVGNDGKWGPLADITSERRIMCAAHDCTSLAIGFERGDIELFANYIENAKKEGRRSKKGFLKIDLKALLGTQLSWHSSGPTDLQFHGPTLLSVGEESVLVTWSTSNDLATTTVRPIHTLPRLASSSLSTLEIHSGLVCITSTDGDIMMTSLSSGDRMWTICGMPSNEVVRDLKVAENSPQGKSFLMYSHKNNVHWLDVAKSVCVRKVGLIFNYVSPANGEMGQKRPVVTHFVESSDWLILCAEQSDTPTSIHFYKPHDGNNKHTLHSILPHPHGAHHKVTAMCSNSSGDALCTVSATAGDIKVYVHGKDDKWRCKYRMQIPSACISHTDNEQVDKKDFNVTLGMSSESQDNVLLVGLARSVQVWDYTEGTLLRRIPCAANVSVQLQTSHMLAVSDQAVELWDLFYGRIWGVDIAGSKNRFGSVMRVTHAMLLPDLETLCMCVDHVGQDQSLISLIRIENGGNSKKITEQNIKSKVTGMSYCKQMEQVLVVAITGNIYAFHKDGSGDVRGKKKRQYCSQIDSNLGPSLPILDFPRANKAVIEANNSTSAYKYARVGITDGSDKKQVGIGVKSDDLPVLSRQYLRGFLSSRCIGLDDDKVVKEKQ